MGESGKALVLLLIFLGLIFLLLFKPDIIMDGLNNVGKMVNF